MSSTPITITGNLTRDPELNFIGAGGTPKIAFGVACEHSFKRGDEWETQTSFVNVIAWRKLAEQARDVLEKGVRVVVVGRLEIRSYEADDGSKRSITEIVADDIGVSAKAIDGIHRRPKQSDGGGSSSTPAQSSSNDDPWDD